MFFAQLISRSSHKGTLFPLFFSKVAQCFVSGWSRRFPSFGLGLTFGSIGWHCLGIIQIEFYIISGLSSNFMTIVDRSMAQVKVKVGNSVLLKFPMYGDSKHQIGYIHTIFQYIISGLGSKVLIKSVVVRVFSNCILYDFRSQKQLHDYS